MGKNNIDKAIEAFKRALRVNPNNLRALYELAKLYDKKTEYDKAIKTIKRAIKLKPKTRAAWNNLGTLYSKKTEFDKALIAYNSALKINSNYKDAWRNLGLVYIQKNQYNEAIKALKRAVKIDPRFKYAWNNLGIAYVKNNEHNKAIEAFKRAIDLDPNYQDALMNLGLVYKEISNGVPAVNFTVKNFQFSDSSIKGTFTQKDTSTKGNVHAQLDILNYTMISENERKIRFHFKLETEPYIGAISFEGDFVLVSSDQLKINKLIQKDPNFLRKLTDKTILKQCFSHVEKVIGKKGPSFSLERIISHKGNLMFTRPIIKTGNWERLKEIEDEKITTEIILTARPDFNLRNGIYKIGTLDVSFEVAENTILRAKGKIMEVNYDPNKLPGRRPMPQEIPSTAKNWLNEILRQNKAPAKYFLKDTNWATVIVNYKLNDKIIAKAEYPKISGPSNMKFD
jgi:tetratricopeptide (TPR) repeat protein